MFVKRRIISVSTTNWKTIAYWVTTILGPFSFVIGGTMFLFRGEQQISVLEQLHYPEYMLTILGFWKLCGAIISVVPGLPRLKEWVYAGFFFELSGAAVSHAFSGAGIGTIAQPLLFLVLVMASWALRPASRKLPSARAF
jgi:hypothetical protein